MRARVEGPVAAPRAKCGVAHERLGQQAAQFLAIDGIHSPTIGENECGTWATVDGYQQGLAALA
jgi:hypothetical protein